MSYVRMSDLAGMNRHSGMGNAASVQAAVSQINSLVANLQALGSNAAQTESTGGDSSSTASQADSVVGQIGVAASTAWSDTSVPAGTGIASALQQLMNDAQQASPTTNAVGINAIAATLAGDLGTVQANMSQVTTTGAAATPASSGGPSSSSIFGAITSGLQVGTSIFRTVTGQPVTSPVPAMAQSINPTMLLVLGLGLVGLVVVVSMQQPQPQRGPVYAPAPPAPAPVPAPAPARNRRRMANHSRWAA